MYSTPRRSPACLVYLETSLAYTRLYLAAGSQPRTLSASQFHSHLASPKDLIGDPQDQHATTANVVQQAVSTQDTTFRYLRPPKRAREQASEEICWFRKGLAGLSGVSAVAYVTHVQLTVGCHRTINVDILKS